MTEFFNNEFLSALPLDANESQDIVLKQFFDWSKSTGVVAKIGRKVEIIEDELDIAIETLTLLNIIRKKYNQTPLNYSNVSSYNQKFLSLIKQFEELRVQISHELKEKVIENKIAENAARFSNAIETLPIIEFTKDEIKTIQNKINDLRNFVVTSSIFEDNHKGRILARLEALQGELHKKIPNTDKFFGLLSDAGVALGKFGNDAKPFGDLVKSIVGIVWGVQARAESLPDPGSIFPMLTDKSTEESEE